jgi:signal peptidase II
VDFLHFYVGEHSWPSFNVADSCICIAAGLLFLSAFQKAPAKAPAAG